MTTTDLSHSLCPSEGEIGSQTQPEQDHRNADFIIMVVGESGLGKSTLINSLFLTDVYKERDVPSAEDKTYKTVKIEKKTIELEEKGVRLRLTVVDTPGFGDAVNSEESCRSITGYIEEQFNQFFQQESRLNRKNIVDNRVHCCLYFIPPWGHGLRQLDVEFMRQLHQKVNIVPIIGKADTLTPKEVRQMKCQILSDLKQHQLKVYRIRDCERDGDYGINLEESIPFAVVSSTQVVNINGRRVRGRLYPWGIVEVENPQHSDFLKLRAFLMGQHMQDLKGVTRDVYYENYRAQYIQRIAGKQGRKSVKTTHDGISEADRLHQVKEEETRRMQEMLRQTSRDTPPEASTPEASTPDLDTRRDGDSAVNL